MTSPTRATSPAPEPGGPEDRRSGRSLGADIIIANAPDPVLKKTLGVLSK
jgi:hypothetical protein